MRAPVIGAALALPFLLVIVACDAGPQVANGEPLSVLDSLHFVGESLYVGGEFEPARVVFERELGRARETGDSVAVARSLTWLAQAAWRLGEYEEARRLGEESLRRKLEIGEGVNLFRSYNLLGLIAWDEFRPLDAIEHFEHATEAATAAGDSANLAKVWNNLGLVATDLGRYEEARNGFIAARETAHALEEPLIEGRALINLAMLALEVGDPLEAMDRLAEARPLLETANDAVGEQVLLGHMGTAYAAVGDPGRAIAHLDQALRRSRENGLREEEAINLEQLANLHREAGNHRRALALLAEAGRIDEELELARERGINRRQEARIHAEIGNRRLAVRKATEALEIHREADAPFEELSDRVLLAKLSAEDGSIETARIHLTEADRLAVELGTRSARIEAALGRARVADRAGDSSEILRIVDEIQEDLVRVGDSALWEAEALRARAHAREGRLPDAIASGRRAIEAIERVRAAFGSGELRTSYLRGREDVYSHQVEVLLRLGEVEEAFAVADAARGRALVEHFASARGSNGRGGDQASHERLLWRVHELAERLDEIDRATKEEAGPELARQAERLYTELARARAEYAAARVRADEQSRRLAAVRRGVRPEEVRTALDPGETLLEYFVTPERVIAFVIDRRGIRTFESEIGREELTVQVRVARETIGRPGGDSAAANAVLRRLHDLLIAPLSTLGLNEGRRLLVVPHAELEYLPFPALQSRRTRRYLAEDFVVVHAPSAGALILIRQMDRPAGSSRGATGLAPFPERLPASAIEIDSFRRAVRGAQIEKGRKATEDRLRRALARDRVVHVATHGILNVRNPMFSRIELAAGRPPRDRPWLDDGRFEVHELLGLSIASDLVFLSGCETGLGVAGTTRYDRGEDYATLTQAFQLAGAGSVVATLWPVEDEGAAALAERFYGAYQRVGPAEALAAAQRAMLADERWRSPYHWAAYRVTGR